MKMKNCPECKTPEEIINEILKGDDTNVKKFICIIR